LQNHATNDAFTEVCIGSGKPLLSQPEKTAATSILIGLEAERSVMCRINQRVDIMMKEGLLGNKTPYPNRI
jgi:tRNA A37 N6-isopentenylltransferase MiaA